MNPSTGRKTPRLCGYSTRHLRRIINNKLKNDYEISSQSSSTDESENEGSNFVTQMEVTDSAYSVNMDVGT